MTTDVIHAPHLGGWSRKHSHAVLAILAFVVLAGLVAFWAWSKDAERRALMRMPAVERAVLYQETRASTESVCQRAAVDSALKERCLDSAEFLLVFPECDTACQTLARQFTAQPAR